MSSRSLCLCFTWIPFFWLLLYYLSNIQYISCLLVVVKSLVINIYMRIFRIKIKGEKLCDDLFDIQCYFNNVGRLSLSLFFSFIFSVLSLFALLYACFSVVVVVLAKFYSKNKSTLFVFTYYSLYKYPTFRKCIQDRN
jgi:hypothetical protein